MVGVSGVPGPGWDREWRQAGVAAGCERPGGFAERVQSREALRGPSDFSVY